VSPDAGRVATVVIPTHDHGSLLTRALSSAQRQSVADIEIFVIGDGVPDSTRDSMAKAQAADTRVRFFDNPKRQRHGERHRHAALAAATGRIVCYLSDDDLWCPSHVAVMDRLLDGTADWANSLPVQVDGDGELVILPVDVAVTAERDRLMGGWNSVPLSCFGHTLEAYRRLPHGWLPAPNTMPTDLHMYQQFLANEWCRARSGFTFTVLNFPSTERRDWDAQRRIDELDHWLPILTDANRRDDLVGLLSRLIGAVSQQFAGEALAHRRAGTDWEAWYAHRNRESERLEATADTLRLHAEQLRNALDERERELADERFRSAELMRGTEQSTRDRARSEDA
jgi:GalNAc5-diNAcBac-PP-undecaprenol beta-1,3-glucosyltransferase